ncbi:septum formation initiator [Streptomyces sp. Ru73]|uniref:septum site-determining protein Ssd n=1 Tax=Streptomyces sp. Ru73 TaxID=2080748 RepID=UPI000CDDA043|nr:septum site-determining protein Ssd [Streptomyces sp. Ru73]POX41939.1 septum formation initiator [Streptomyces sp. Ru73]
MAGSNDSDGTERDAQDSGPLIITEDENLLDDLLRLCAAAGTLPAVAHGGSAGTAGWGSAPLVIVGEDCVHRLRGLARRPGVVLIGQHPDETEVWQQAVDIGAERVLGLPDGESWLVDRIADAVEGDGRPALTVGVLGGRGGAGASTLACALAVTAARQGHRTILIDADPLGGGLDVLLGGEREKGLRWPAFAESRGRVGGGALAESLPRLHALRVLSWDRGDSVTIPPEAMRAVMSAARRRGGVVVVDLPRGFDGAVAEALMQIDVGLLLVPAELRATVAARRVAASARSLLHDLRVVTRETPGPGLPDAEPARLLSLPPVGTLPWDPQLADALARRLPPGADPRGPLARFCTEFWARVLDGREPARPRSAHEGPYGTYAGHGSGAAPRTDEGGLS